VGDIIEVLPKNLQQKAKILLRRIQDNSKILDWNDRGELKYNGETLPNTNITNLLGDSLKYRKNNKPKGYEIFTKALSEMNLPEELIRNPEILQLFKTYGYEKTPEEKFVNRYKMTYRTLHRLRKELKNYSGKQTFKTLVIRD
jgi:hypothetical protein